MKPQQQLHSLSKKADENRRVHLIRTNPTSELHKLPNKLGDKVPDGYISRGKGPLKMYRYPNTAESVNHTAVTRPGAYVPGDGDFQVACRPGADDHKKYESITTGGSITYPRSHK